MVLIHAKVIKSFLSGDLGDYSGISEGLIHAGLKTDTKIRGWKKRRSGIRGGYLLYLIKENKKSVPGYWKRLTGDMKRWSFLT